MPQHSSSITTAKDAFAKLINAAVTKTEATAHVNGDEITEADVRHGDLSFALHRLAQQLQKNPVELAATLTAISEKLLTEAPTDYASIASVTATGPYLNARLDQTAFADSTVKAALHKKFTASPSAKKKYLLEYVSPNTNKPLHLGHLRNAALGWSIGELLKATGSKVVRAQVVNDRGIHIMKSLLAYERWGNNETPESSGLKGDHLVGKYYVRFSNEEKENPKLIEEAQVYLKRWEEGDQKIRALGAQLNAWAEQGYEETSKRFGIAFDRTDHESELYEAGRKIVMSALKQGLVKKREDGAIVADLSAEGLEEKVLLRSDGTTVYVTQDLALAKKRLAKEKPDAMLYVVGQEQDHQFKILFVLLERFGIAKASELMHLSYHWVLLLEGRMKSREGTVVDADDLLNELHRLALKELTARKQDLPEQELKRRAEVISNAAIKFYLLNVRPKVSIHFDPKASISFTGRTGPYLLYTLARIKSILRKADVRTRDTKPRSVTEKEWIVVRDLARYGEIIESAAKNNDPSDVADYAYTLARSITAFYEADPVLTAEPQVRAWRLNLLSASVATLTHALSLLGITALEEM
ncbi:MAG: arginine--tRNA ligase [Patescibacteria group bacterium]|jgi:arginyl-tRNA synthetase